MCHSRCVQMDENAKSREKLMGASLSATQSNQDLKIKKMEMAMLQMQRDDKHRWMSMHQQSKSMATLAAASMASSMISAGQATDINAAFRRSFDLVKGSIVQLPPEPEAEGDDDQVGGVTPIPLKMPERTPVPAAANNVNNNENNNVNNNNENNNVNNNN